MRRAPHAASSLLLAGGGAGLLVCAALGAAHSCRRAARAAPSHPFGAAAGFLALPLSLALWSAARARWPYWSPTDWRSWSLREAA